MSYTGGDVLEWNYNHPTLGEGTFFIKANEEVTIDKGGFRTDDDMEGIAGNGRSIRKIQRKRWMCEGPIAWDMITEDELSKLSALAADPIEANWTISHVNGTVWSGLGSPVGDIPGNAQEATIPIKISGGGRLEKIS